MVELSRLFYEYSNMFIALVDLIKVYKVLVIISERTLDKKRGGKREKQRMDLLKLRMQF